ncbi:choice-of-anchor A family protein [bacterium]|nr:choice-of-anchor A family protein [bacterium]
MKKILLSIIFLLSGLLLLTPSTVFATEIEDLSLEQFLQNYSLISLGHRNNGNATVYHVTSNFLVNGTIQSANAHAIITEADSLQSLCSTSTTNFYYHNSGYIQSNLTNCSALDFNFDTLYNNIVAKQAEIQSGIPVEGTSLELKTGSSYNIVNVNDLEEIIFTDITNEGSNLTVFTILDSGAVSLPSLYWYGENDEKHQFITNDKFGGATAYNANGISPQSYTTQTGRNQPTYYKYDDVYHGNIVWNIPNATSVTLSSGVPFVGHIIAPNADITMAESNTAGSVIANSFTGAGNTEIHSYPLQQSGLLRNLNPKNETVKLDCDCEGGDSRPESVTIYLAANGTRIRSIVLNRENNYTYELSDLPETLDGSTDIEYTLEGAYIDEYVENIDGFNLVLGCTDAQKADNTDKKEPESNSTAGEQEKVEKNPVTDDKVPYFVLVSIVAFVALLVTTMSLYIKNRGIIIKK